MPSIWKKLWWGDYIEMLSHILAVGVFVVVPAAKFIICKNTNNAMEIVAQATDNRNFSKY